MSRWYNLHIKNEMFFWFFIVSLLPIFILFLLNYSLQEERFKEQAQKQLELILNEKISKIETNIAVFEHDIKLLSQIPSVIESFKKCHQLFQSQPKECKEIDSQITLFLDRKKFHDLLFINLQGDVVYTLKKEDDFGTNLLSGIYKETNLASVYSNAKMFLETKLSTFMYYPPSHTHAAFMAHPLYDDKKLLGVIAIQLNQEKLFEIFNDHDGLGESGELFAAYKNPQNKILSATPLRYIENSVQNEYEFPKRDSLVSRQAISGMQGFGVTKDYRDVEVIAAWDYIPSLRWGIVAKIDLNEILKPIDDLEFYSIIVLFFVVMIVIVAIVLVTKNLVTPIEILIQRVKNISLGNLEETSQERVYANNEIGLLWANFNEMAHNLKISQQTIKQYANELEEKVKSRTKELENATKELSDTNYSMQKHIDIIDKYVIVSSTNLAGVIIDASSAFCDITGYTKEELIGKQHNIIRHPNMPKELYVQMWENLKQNQIWSGEIQNLRKDGSSYWVFSMLSPVYDRSGKKIGYTSIRQDITYQKMLEELSIKDRLTSLYNRVKLESAFEEEMKRAKRYGNTFSVIMADIDHFKSVNDTYGHDVGDETLVTFARILKQHVRETDVVGRWGGEEFLILLPQTSSDAAYEIAQKLRENIEKHPFETIRKCTASFGLSTFTNDDTMQSLVKRVDNALYESKKSGRNRVSRA